eukprot:7143972-Ditylum_brightwellii.AAC.1
MVESRIIRMRMSDRRLEVLSSVGEIKSAEMTLQRMRRKCYLVQCCHSFLRNLYPRQSKR